MTVREAAVTQEETQTPLRVLAFGLFRLHRRPHLLCLGDEPIRLGGRAIDLLVALAERAGEVVSRAELERQVWPHTLVEDSSLRVHIAALRKALGDGIGEARYIANVPGRGYSFVATVVELSGPAAKPGVQIPEGGARPLPVRLSSIVGREEAVSALRANLPARRLATIVGHGGMGKTALAVVVASELQSNYPDGACFFDMAPLDDPAFMPDALAAALGVTALGDDVMTTLEQWLQPRRMLLLMDNCEHVLEAAAKLVDRILRVAPGIDVLATSREPLDAEGEWVHRLQPLTFPDEAMIGGLEAMQFSALRLLAERAAASIDSFELNEATLPAAIALCRRLDGVPLAIEFAAARVGLLGVQGVVAQLDDRLRLLGSGRRTVLPRHRTLRALLDWSYDLLSPCEQRVLRCCGIFNGPFTLESAVAVIAHHPHATSEVRDSVLSLIAKSLIVSEPGTPHVNFSMLEITRAYAADRLAVDPEYRGIAARHARRMCDVMRQCERDWDTMPRAAWLRSYLRYMGNVRAALNWAFGPDGDAAVGVRLAAAMMLRMGRISGEEELRAHARHALVAIASGTPADPIDEMRLHSILAVTIGPGSEVVPLHLPILPCFVEALDNAGCQQSPHAEIEALYHLGVRCFAGGDYRAMREYAMRSMTVATEAGDEVAILHSERMGAQALHFLGNHEQARAMAKSVLASQNYALPLRITSPVDRRVSMRIVLARALWMQGFGARAAAMAAECVDIAANDLTPLSLAQALSFGACPVALWRGDHEGARALIERLFSHADRHGMDYWRRWAEQYRHVLAIRMGGASGVAEGLPPDPKLLDHLATFSAELATPAALARCTKGLVGWSAPELLRLHGEQLHRAADAGAEDVLLQALVLAHEQKASAWALRCATSLAVVWTEQGRHVDAVARLAPLVAQLGEGHDGADLRGARALLERWTVHREAIT